MTALRDRQQLRREARRVLRRGAKAPAPIVAEDPAEAVHGGGGGEAPSPPPDEAGVLLAEIDAWCAATGQTPLQLGQMALNHGGFVPLLIKRRSLKAGTAALVREFMILFPTEASLVGVAEWQRGVREEKAEARAGKVRRAPPTSPESLKAAAREEALSSVTRRKRARMIGGVLKPVDAPSPTAMALDAMDTGIGDAIAMMKRRWPVLWAELVRLAQAAERLPSEMMADALELGCEALRDDLGLPAGGER